MATKHPFSPPSQPARRVLIVEDDHDLRTLLSTELAGQGFLVEEASDGITALAKLNEQRSDVILLDLMLPRLSGVGFLRSLQAVDAPPPVVVYSTFAEPIVQGFANVTAVVRKTASLDELVAAIHRASGRAPVTP